MAGVVFIGLTGFLASAETVTLEDTQERKIEAEILAFDGKTVTFKRTGQEKTYTLDVDKLTESTQDDLIALNDIPTKAEAEKTISLPKESFLHIKFSSGKTSKRTNRQAYDDERTETLSPTVSIQNRDSKTDLTCKMPVAVFGRGIVEKRSIKVLAKKTFDVKVKGGTNDTLALDEFFIKYDREWNQHRFKYHGYVVALLDDENKVTRVVASQPNNEQQVRKVFKVEVGKVYDTELIKEVTVAR
jgi:hypothetical protein